ncbi:MAG: hypothetical protein ACR2F8_03890 [Caulobacteraceae bacterium]
MELNHQTPTPPAIKCFSLGSCGIHLAHRLLIRARLLCDPFAQLGFRRRPLALSSGGALQTYDFCLGKTIAPRILPIAQREMRQPTPRTRRVVDDSEIALIELSTPIEPIIEGVIVNFNLIRAKVIKPLREAGVESMLVARWANALVAARQDLRERAGDLLAAWPGDLGDDGLARFAVEQLSVRRLEIDDMVRDLERLCDRLGAPLALQLYTFKYMPDGRAIDWPAGFRAQQIEVARRLGLPTLDLEAQVSSLGIERLIAEDLRHWRPDTLPLQAQLSYDFLAGVLGWAAFDRHPRSLDIRREVQARFPELSAVAETGSLT